MSGCVSETRLLMVWLWEESELHKLSTWTISWLCHWLRQAQPEGKDLLGMRNSALVTASSRYLIGCPVGMSGKHLAIWIWSSQRCQGWKTQMCWLFEPPWAFVLIPTCCRSSRGPSQANCWLDYDATFQQEGGSDLSSLQGMAVAFLVMCPAV